MSESTLSTTTKGAKSMATKRKRKTPSRDSKGRFKRRK